MDHTHRQPAVEQELATFLDQTRDYVAGSLDADTYRPERLRWGLFFQGEQTMLRVAIPGGRLTAAQLRRLASVQHQYAPGGAHFTTRQNLQFYGTAVADVPALLAELARDGLYTLQTSGPCIRKITLDPLAGLAPDEADNPWPWWGLLQRWATLHPAFSNLPRKFKIALTAGHHDRVGLRMHDIGLRLVAGSGADARFEVWAGGGLGRRPRLAPRLFAELPGRDLLRHLEALLRLYDRHGQRTDKQRARLKDFVHNWGAESLRDAVTEEAQRLPVGGLAVDEARLAEATARGPRPPSQPLLNDEDLLEQWATANPAFAEWLRWNTEPQRPAGARAVTVSLRGRGQPSGAIDAAELTLLAELAEAANGGEVRCTPTQHLLIPHVPLEQLGHLWERLSEADLADPYVGTLADPVSCPGSSRCELANAPTTPVAEAIRERLRASGLAHAAGSGRLAVAGCMNACSHGPLADIALRGVEKADGDWYQILIGGRSGDAPALARPAGPAVPAERVADVAEAIVHRQLALRSDPTESISQTIERTGIKSFRDCLAAGEPGDQEPASAERPEEPIEAR